MKRVVLDTNIIISSALGGELVFVLEKWDEGRFTVCAPSAFGTSPIFDENGGGWVGALL